VLLHGTPLTPAIWHETAAHLDGNVHIPDCTRVPRGPNPQAELAHRIVNDVAGTMDLVGHSFGGQVAIEIALLAPERVRSLTIVCSRDTPFPAFASVAAAIEAGTPPDIEATLTRWLSPAEVGVGGAVVDEIRRELASASLDDWAAALDAIARYDSTARTPTLAMPVNLIAAGADAVATPDSMRALQDRVPGARLSVHAAWHHLSPFLNPASLALDLTAGRTGYAAPT
jgi:pimeloyl-ACP methyl ester carboxylesterase